MLEAGKLQLRAAGLRKDYSTGVEKCRSLTAGTTTTAEQAVLIHHGDPPRPMIPRFCFESSDESYRLPQRPEER
jgi:hypothetical protein